MFDHSICNFFPSFTLRILRVAVDLLGGGIRIEEKELSEEELCKRMKNGDDHSFEILYERYFEKIYAFIVRRVGAREIAEDLVSNIFMKAFASRARFIWKTSFKSWLYQIASNTLIDHYRSHKSTVSFNPEVHTEPSEQPSTNQEIDTASLRQMLNSVLLKLDSRTQTVIQLKFFGEYDHQEIANMMNISANHVGVLLFRGLKKCQKLIVEK